MSGASTIEWTDTTWNPTTGCDRISPGCSQCYALTLARRLKAMGQVKYQTDGDPRTSGPGFGVAVHEDVLTEPLSWRQPRMVFVNSMSDVGHARIPPSFVARMFAVMAVAAQHSFQVLTKRPKQLASVLGRQEFRTAMVYPEIERLLREHPGPTGRLGAAGRDPFTWPPPNVWLGTSIESDGYCRRAGALRAAPAALRFLSLEPLLEPLPSLDLAGMDWVIVGGESGPKARPMHPDWVRSLRDQCQAARVAFFFKQWGEWAPLVPGVAPGKEIRAYPGALLQRVGKKRGGRVLDGRTWDEYPGGTTDG